MITYEASTSVAADPESIWAVLADVPKWPDWLPTVKSVQPLDGQPLAFGSRYRLVQPKLRPATWVVTVVEAPHRFAWESSSPGLRIVGDHIVNRPAGATVVVLRLSFSGLLGGLVGRLARRLAESYLSLEAVSLKQTVEGASGKA